MTHACPQRPGYAIGHEGGLILCTWPRGGKPTLPFIYSDEVWTGIEYQVASHMIAEGMVDEGVRSWRPPAAAYDGQCRNPFNEYECGNYYARAMASYALLQAYSGFRYSAVERTLWLEPKTTRRPFRTFFSTAGAHGTIEVSRTTVTVRVLEGQLRIEEFALAGNEMACGQTASPERPVTIALSASKPRQAASSCAVVSGRKLVVRQWRGKGRDVVRRAGCKWWTGEAVRDRWEDQTEEPVGALAHPQRPRADSTDANAIGLVWLGGYEHALAGRPCRGASARRCDRPCGPCTPKHLWAARASCAAGTSLLHEEAVQMCPGRVVGNGKI